MNFLKKKVNYVAVKCPTCKALFETNSDHIVCLCEECGTKFVIDEAIVYKKQPKGFAAIMDIVEKKEKLKLEKERRKFDEEKLKQEENKKKEIEENLKKEKNKKIWKIILKIFLWYLAIGVLICIIGELIGIKLSTTKMLISKIITKF